MPPGSGTPSSLANHRDQRPCARRLPRWDDAPHAVAFSCSADCSTATMRYGTGDVLELRTVDRPQMTSTEVLIEVHAAGVDRGVVHLVAGAQYLIRAAGYGMTKPKRLIPRGRCRRRAVAVGDESPASDRHDEGVRGRLRLVRRVRHGRVAAVSGGTALHALIDVGKIEAEPTSSTAPPGTT